MKRTTHGDRYAMILRSASTALTLLDSLAGERALSAELRLKCLTTADLLSETLAILPTELPTEI